MSCRTTTIQEISREPCLITSREEVLSDFEEDRDASVISIPCSNRFNALEEEDHSGFAPQKDIDGQANDDQMETKNVEDSLEISNLSEASPTQNRLCNLCKTVRVSERYHVRCDACFSKHGLYTRLAFQ